MAGKLLLIIPGIMYGLLIAVAVAVHQAPTGETPQPTPTATPVAPAVNENKTGEDTASERNRNIREGLKTVVEGSRAISQWALLMIGASIVAIVSTSYLRPLNLKVRLTYLLFIPGWVLIGISTYYGDVISRRYMAAMLTARWDVLHKILENVNTDFASQQFYFQVGLLVFSVWLISFLMWWVFGSWTASTNANK